MIVATFAMSGDSAIIWETYQITQNLHKKTFRIGDWTQGGASGLAKGLAPEERWRRRRDIREKALWHGVMRAPIDDPLQHRGDLTGLHLRCAALEVQYLFSQSLSRLYVSRGHRKGWLLVVYLKSSLLLNLIYWTEVFEGKNNSHNTLVSHLKLYMRYIYGVRLNLYSATAIRSISDRVGPLSQMESSQILQRICFARIRQWGSGSSEWKTKNKKNPAL